MQNTKIKNIKIKKFRVLGINGPCPASTPNGSYCSSSAATSLEHLLQLRNGPASKVQIQLSEKKSSNSIRTSLER
jgi:hypothetical protein